MRPVNIFVVIVALFIALIVVFYVRRWRLKEQYSLLWLALAVGMVVPAAAPGLVEWFAGRLDVIYAPSILFFLALAFVAVMLFHYSLEISRLSDQNRELTQEIGLLRARVEDAGPRPAAGRAPVLQPGGPGALDG
ncbi:MAG: DUF2304 domain-containing protein [Dehalococcoidia bacterium]|nr:DUF2304 domain-containing protein [Dehalococcoidia bacterium]